MKNEPENVRRAAAIYAAAYKHPLPGSDLQARADRARDQANAAVYGVIITFCIGPIVALLLALWFAR